MQGKQPWYAAGSTSHRGCSHGSQESLGKISVLALTRHTLQAKAVNLENVVVAEKPFGCGPPEGILVHAPQNEVLQLRAQDSLLWQRHWVAQHLHRQTSSLTSLRIEYTLTRGEPCKGPDRAIGGLGQMASMPCVIA